MPAKSKKQQKFMAAVANNPKFAKKVGVSQTVGEEFMKSKRYNRGGMMAPAPESGPRKKMKRPGQPVPYDDSGSPKGPMPAPLGGPKGSVIVDPAKKKKRAPMQMGQGSGGAMPMMKKGGKVRGCGMAKQGVRKAKMVTMKGA